MMLLTTLICNSEPVYRQCEKEFKNFIEAFTTMLTEVDPQIPPLPPKDVIHRIYRDVRPTASMFVVLLNETSGSFQQRQDTLQDRTLCKLFEERQKGHICFL